MADVFQRTNNLERLSSIYWVPVQTLSSPPSLRLSVPSIRLTDWTGLDCLLFHLLSHFFCFMFFVSLRYEKDHQLDDKENIFLRAAKLQLLPEMDKSIDRWYFWNRPVQSTDAKSSSSFSEDWALVNLKLSGQIFDNSWVILYLIRLFSSKIRLARWEERRRGGERRRWEEERRRRRSQ